MSKVFLKDGKWTTNAKKPGNQNELDDEKEKYHKETYDELMKQKNQQLNDLDESDPEYESKAQKLEKRVEILNKMRRQAFKK